MNKENQKSLYSREAETLTVLLKRVRKERKLTQVDVALRLGRTQSYVSKVEQGEIMIDAVVLFLLCRAMNMPFGEFAGRFEEEWEQLPPNQPEPTINSDPSSDG